MQSLIYGYGKSGKSFARFLESKKYKFDIYDDNLPKYSKKIDLKKYNQILCSPGVLKNIFEKIRNIINKNFDLSTRGIREMLKLNNPIYEVTSAYGHFGRKPTTKGEFSWEKTDKVDLFKL